MERLLHASHALGLALRCHLRLVRTLDRMHHGQLSRRLPATSPAVLEVLGEGREGSQSARVEAPGVFWSRAAIRLKSGLTDSHRLNWRSLVAGSDA